MRLQDNNNKINENLSAMSLENMSINDINALLKKYNLEIDVPKCLHCHQAIDLRTLSDDEKIEFEENHICPKCAKLVEEAQRISVAVKVTTRKSCRSNDTSNGSKARDLLLKAMPKLTPEHIKCFTDPKWSYDNFGLLYPLLLDITGKDIVEVNIMRKSKGHNRYTQVPYTILNRIYLITNDIYVRNTIRIRDTLIKLNLITEDDAQSITSLSQKEKVTGIESYKKKSKYVETEKETSSQFEYISIDDEDKKVSNNSISLNNESDVKIVKKKTKEELLAEIAASKKEKHAKTHTKWRNFKVASHEKKERQYQTKDEKAEQLGTY